MDSVPIYLSRASTVFNNIIYALTIPAERFPPHSRAVGVPGITVTPRQIIEALYVPFLPSFVPPLFFFASKKSSRPAFQ
jgi:hypothetical protein